MRSSSFGRLVAEQDELPTSAGLAGSGRDVDTERAGTGRPGQVPRDGGGGGGQVGRGMDGDRVAPPALDHDRATEEGGDGRRLDVESPPEEREPGELGLEIGGAAVELRAAVHQEADDTAFERHRIDPAEVEGTQPGGARGVAERAERVVAGVALDEQDGRHAGAGQRDRQVVDLCRTGCDDGQCRRGDDRQVAGLERLEGRHAWLEDPDPADLALTALGRQVRAIDGSSGGEQRALQIVERRHAGPGWRTATRSSSSAPNSRSTST